MHYRSVGRERERERERERDALFLLAIMANTMIVLEQ
jgi:hypothetical protein